MFLHRMEMSNLSLDLDFPFLVVGTSYWLNRVSDGQGFSKGLCFVCLLGMALLCLVSMFSLVTTHPICQTASLVFSSAVALWQVSHFAPVQIRIAAVSKAAGRSGRKNEVKI